MMLSGEEREFAEFVGMLSTRECCHVKNKVLGPGARPGH